MKETEKLDLILRQLYKQPGKEGDPQTLLAEEGIPIEVEDARRLAKRLEESGYVERKVSYGTGVPLALKSEGMEFVEGDSFAHRGSPIINNYYNTTISDSTNANIVTHSSQTTITQQHNAEPKQLLEQIRQLITADPTATPNQRQDIIESVDDVQAGLEAGRVPKVSLKQLLDVGSKVSSISSFVMKLGEALDLLP